MLRPFFLLSAVTLRGTHPRLACRFALAGFYPPPYPPPAPVPWRYMLPRRRGRGCYIYNLIPKEGCAPFDNPL